jgi:hypothetical protein
MINQARSRSQEAKLRRLPAACVVPDCLARDDRPCPCLGRRRSAHGFSAAQRASSQPSAPPPAAAAAVLTCFLRVAEPVHQPASRLPGRDQVQCEGPRRQVEMQAASQLPSGPPSQAAQQPLNQLKNRRKIRHLHKNDDSTCAPGKRPRKLLPVDAAEAATLAASSRAGWISGVGSLASRG